MLDLLFEISWEVCNKVGGIYTVLSTKARTLQQKHKDRVLFIGPDLWSKDKESPFFTESASLLADWKATTKFPGGMSVRVGRWNVPGSPIAILVNYRPLFAYKNELYAKMWDLFRVDSLHAYGDYDESCMFAYGAALVIERIVKWRQGKARRVVAHFDEWMTGMGLLYVKAQLPSVGTVFTTHATSRPPRKPGRISYRSKMPPEMLPQMPTITAPVTMPASAPIAESLRQNRARITVGPNEAPNPAHAKATRARMVSF